MAAPVNKTPITSTSSSISMIAENGTAMEATAKKVKSRCQYSQVVGGKPQSCRFKLMGMTEVEQCKCGKVFCGLHKLPLAHNCTFNHRLHYKNILIKKLSPRENELRVVHHRDKPSGNSAC
jgi:hypothetical protein